MIPPTKPNVTRLSDESVMVHWSVPQNEGLPIEFFKVQFKEADKSGSRWKTIDEDIPSHIRSYEVSGLKAGLTYRFRIAAVYTNNDNKLGQTSARFVLEKEPPKKKPAHIPLIEQAQAESPSAVNIYWKVIQKIHSADYVKRNTSPAFSIPIWIACQSTGSSFTTDRQRAPESTQK